MPVQPVNEDDKPAMVKIIKRLVSFRKREMANNGKAISICLDEAISVLHQYGEIKGWFDTEPLKLD